MAHNKVTNGEESVLITDNDYLDEEWDEDLTILREIIWECLLVPFVVCDSTRTKVSNSPDEESHRLSSEATGNVITKPFEAFTAVVGRKQETVHSFRRRDLVLTSIFRILTKSTKDFIAVDIANETKDPHAETNNEANIVEGG